MAEGSQDSANRYLDASCVLHVYMHGFGFEPSCAYMWAAGKLAGTGYFVFWAPSGSLYTSIPQAEKQGFVDDDTEIQRLVEGVEAQALKDERKALMYKARAVPRLHNLSPQAVARACIVNLASLTQELR